MRKKQQQQKNKTKMFISLVIQGTWQKKWVFEKTKNKKQKPNSWKEGYSVM